MKLVLKYNETVKLFPSHKHFHELITFVQNEFHLEKDSLNLSYSDTDGDVISLMSTEDFDIMLSLLQGKDYIKIKVEGQMMNQSQKSMKQELDSDIFQEKFEVLQDNTCCFLMNQKRKCYEQQKSQMKQLQTQSQFQKVKENLCSSKKSKNDSINENQSNLVQRDYQFDKELNEKIIRLVDERIQVLIPSLRQQLSPSFKQNLPSLDLVHVGYTCKGCSVKTIIGVRYECPKCFDYNLCEKCENKIDHQHHLLKIKKNLSGYEEEQSNSIFVQNIKQILTQGRKRHCQRSHPYQCPLWLPKKHNSAYLKAEQVKIKSEQMVVMFGGQPNDYREFCLVSDDLTIEQTFSKYAELNGISENEYFKSMVQYKCSKIEKYTGKSREQFRNIVHTNIHSSNEQLINIIQQGNEKKRSPNRGIKKMFKFDNTSFAQAPKRSRRQQQRLAAKYAQERRIAAENKENAFNEQLKKLQHFNQQKKKEQEEEENLLKKSLHKEISDRKDKKIALINLMNDLFGPQNQTEYSKFVQQNFELEKEEIIELWLNSASF